jgi:subtilisin family serine protease
MEKEYAVVIKKGQNLQEIEDELKRSTGSESIPARSVDVVNPRNGSKRMTHFFLTDEEAKALANDSRIEAVEIPPDQRTDIQISKRALQNADFTKPSSLNNSYVNWGIKRSIMPTNLYNDQTSVDSEYPYALQGQGVDVVIQDSGIEPQHPEWQDSKGNSRFVARDWYDVAGLSGTLNANFYRDFDGHGTHCAGIVAGKTYGYAKESMIYAQKLLGLEGSGDTGTGMPIADSFDAIRLWHESKPIDPTTGQKRPTVVNMSWGYFNQLSGDPISGTYRGTGWVYGVDYLNDLTLWAGTGLVVPTSGITRFLPSRVAATDAEVDDLIASGVHVFIAAGNDYFKGDISTGTDYNNSVVYGASTYFYHRGSSPHSDDAFIVGNIDTNTELDGDNHKDKIQGASSRGPRVNVFAPGTNIVSAVSNTSVYTQADYPQDSNYKVAMISGTSFAAPQIAGVAALHLSATPGITPTNIKNKIENEAKNVMFETGLDNDYTAFDTSLMGAPNRILFNKYGRQPVEINGANLKLEGIFPNYTVASPAIDPEYNNGAIIDLTGDGSNFFSREVTVNGVRIVAAGTVGGQTAVPDAFVEKVARMFELFTDPNGAGINEASQRTFIKTLSGDAGTYHAAVGPTLQRVARGAGADYTPNFLTDAGIASYNLSPLFDSHVANDMVWYLNSTGDPPGDGDNDAQEVIEHVFHTLHMHGLDAVSLKMYSYISADWASGPLYAAMEEAYDAGKWDSSGYGGNAWKTDGDAFEVAAKEYLFLLNFAMFEYTELWDGGSLAPEWSDDMRTQAGIQANNPLGYALHNTYIAPVISKPSLTTIRNIFQDGDVGDPTVAGPSGYVPD